MSTTAAEEPHATLVWHCYHMTPKEFVEMHAPHHEFRDLCLAVAEVHNLTYDHAVIVVRHRWPADLATLAA